MSEPETPNQRLASLLLGQPVRDWIAEQRAIGATWRTVANALRIETDGQVDVSHEAVRGWFDETEQVA